jgi:hypothetical protein
MPDFPLAGVVSTPGGLMRADQRTRAERTCGCGRPALVALMYATFQQRNGRIDRRTRRIPLCAEHDAASVAKRRRRYG